MTHISAQHGHRLVRYVVDGQLLERPSGAEFKTRVAYAACLTSVYIITGEATTKAIAIESQGVQSIKTAGLEMQAVADRNSRLKAPADVHYVLSWREGGRPTPEQTFEAGRATLGVLELGAHQYVL